MIDLKLKQKLLKKDEKGLEVFLNKACIQNNVELVEYLLFSEELNIHPDIASRNYQALRDGANQGSFEVIKYLFEEACPKRKLELINARKQVLIRNACHSGNLKLVQYLLETPGIKEYVRLSINDYKPFEEGLYSFNKDLVMYLYEKCKHSHIYNKSNSEKYNIGKYLNTFFQKIYKPKFLEFAKELLQEKEMDIFFIGASKMTALSEFINQNNKEGIEFLLANKKIKKQVIDAMDSGVVMVSMSKANIDILNLIIVENEIPLTKILEDFLNNKNYDTSNMRKMFENRELYKRLSTNLTSNETEINHKKSKI